MLHFLNFTLSPPLWYLLKTTKYGMREKKNYYIYGCFSVLRYIKGCTKQLHFLDTHVRITHVDIVVES